MTQTIAEGVVSVSFDGSQVEAGVAKTTKSINSLAQSGAKAGKDGAAGIRKMADGASEASSKIDANTKRIARSIENTIATAKAGSRGTAAFYESIANIRGANLDVLRPYINQLKEVELQAKQAKTANDKLATSARSNSGDFSLLGSSIKSAALAYASLSSVTAIAKLSDQYKTFNAQLKNSTSSQAEFGQAFENVSRIAQSAQIDVADLSKAYARFGNSLKDVGASQKEISDLTETLSLALKVNGATADEATSVMLQFSQALGKGKLDGDEFKSVMEAAPNVMRELAKSMNVPFGALKDLASQGQITGDVLLKAFTNQEFLNALRVQASAMRTIGGEVQVLKNEFLLFIGTVSNKSGTVDLFTGAIRSASLAVKELNQYMAEGKVTLDTFLPAYDAYRKKLDEENGLKISPLFSPRPKINETLKIDDFKIFDKDKAATYKQAGEAVAFLRDNVKLYTEELKKQADIQSKAKFAFDNDAIDQKTYNKIIEDSKDAIKKLNGEKEKTAKLSALQKLQLKLEGEAAQSAANAYADLLKQAQSLTKPQQTQAEIVKELADSYSKLDKSVRSYIDAQVNEAQDNALLEKLDEENNARIDQIEAIKQQAIELENENANYGKLPSAITQVTIAEKERTKAMLESNGLATEQIESEILALKRLYIARAGNESNKANEERVKADKEANDKIVKQHEEMANDINKSLTDALLRGFENGKSFAQNFKDTLKNMFKSLVLQPIVKFLVDGSGVTKMLGSLGGILGGSSTASASQILGGGGTDIATSLFKGLSGIQGSITGGIEKLGAMLATGNGGLLDSLGGFLGANAASIGNALPFAGAALQALTGNLKGAAFTAAGAAIGSIIPGIGTAIGGAIGGIVGSLFGGKKIPLVGSKASGVFENGKYVGTTAQVGKKDIGAQASLESLNNAFASQLSGLLKAFGNNTSVAVQSLFRTRTNVRGFFGATVDGESFYSEIYKDKAKRADFQKFVDAVLGSELVKAIQISKLPDGIKSLFDGLTDKTQVSNMIGASTSLAEAQSTLASRFGLTVDQAGKVAVATGLAGDNLAKFVTTLSSSANAFLSTGESILKVKSSLTDGLGGTLPTTLQAFDNALKGIDKSTQAGIEAFTEMFSLREQFSAFTLSLENLKGGVKGALYGIVSDSEKQSMLNADLSKIFGDLGRDVPSSVQELIELGKTIDFTTEEGLNLAAVFPSLVNAFVETRGSVNDLMNSLRDVNEFQSLVDFNRYKGVANNYGSAFANNYVDGLTSNGAAVNFTSNANAAGVASNNTTVSTSDPNVLNAIVQLKAEIALLKDGIDKTALHSKRAADVLVNVSPNGDAIQTEAA